MIMASYRRRDGGAGSVSPSSVVAFNPNVSKRTPLEALQKMKMGNNGEQSLWGNRAFEKAVPPRHAAPRFWFGSAHKKSNNSHQRKKNDDRPN